MVDDEDKHKDLEDLSFISEDSYEYTSFGTENNNNDNLAIKEEKNWGKERGELDGKHGVILEKALFRIAVFFIYLLSILFCLLLLIWFYHLVTPKCYKWLGHESVQSIERILFASTLLSLAGKYFSKYEILKRS
ncbi:hypothetical protein DVK85_07185 [Flavobacterium arcticum]|uniref:Uncharacterized protein n=1 Tax=Flavobacterium arcticum TaxID=1784713 RepID=A0A345HBT0_9FLAO|nr:hypothetical protein [Flavobacterium arcticum]AXG74040.1 hypothetical protein DVK85_07185 [Flavobacterium arcticum]KAF2509015.1 hypothetical protein E0W72_10660 [Flavobacterium arcticum]